VITRDRRGRVLAERSIDPFEVGTLVICVLYGLVGLAWYDTLTLRTVKLYPFIGGRVFLAALAIGSATALIGLARNNLRGLRLERAGLRLLVCLGVSFALWTPFTAGAGGISMLVSFGILLGVPGAVVSYRRGLLIRKLEGVNRARERPRGPNAPA